MFKLHRHRHGKSKERVDFKFSHLKLLQVPKGWDKLFVSIISVETGKTIAKSSKALARNGNCQWADTLLESIWLSHDVSSKEQEECLLKLVVSMGSARSTLLGEAIFNMTSYMSSNASVPSSFLLKKCNYGTTLQVQIQCLTPKSKLRDGESKETNFHLVDPNADHHDMEIRSDASGTGSTFARSTGSSSSKDLGSASLSVEPETSFSASGSHNSFDSAEGSLGRESFSYMENLSGDGHRLIGKQDSLSSQNGVPPRNYLLNESQNNQKEFAASSLKITGSSKNLLEAAEDTIEEIRAEAKLWERSARKLMSDLDMSRKESSDQAKKHRHLEMELSAAQTECDSFKKEVEQMKLLLKNSTAKQTVMDNSTFHDEGFSHIQKELENEIKLQKESNANLALQLNQNQESNIELVSVLQELEETIENQKIQIEKLSSENLQFGDLECSTTINGEENLKLTRQLQQLHESEKRLQDKVQVLEQDLGVKCELCAKKEKLSESLVKTYSAEEGSITDRLIRENEALKEKVQDLERDCNELADENLELLIKLKETKNSFTGGDACFDVLSGELSIKSLTSSEVEANKQKLPTHHLLGNLNNHMVVDEHPIQGSSEKELQVKATELDNELDDKFFEIKKLEDSLLSKQEEIGVLRQCQSELEAKISKLQVENVQLEENMNNALKESTITSKCSGDLQSELMMLSGSVDPHVSANEILERKSSELQREKCEVGHHLLLLEQENLRLSECLSGLESQMRYLTDEKESCILELENSKSLAASLTDEIRGLTIEMEIQTLDLKQQLQEMQKQWSETQEECEYLRGENLKLQTIADNLFEQCSSLQISNTELWEQKLELQAHCKCLEIRLREADEMFSDCSKRTDVLEKNLSSMLADFASKEKTLALQLDAVLEENRKQKDKLTREEILYSQMNMERAVEVENLQQEVERLTNIVSVTNVERERMFSDAMDEVSVLHADKAKLETNLEEIYSKLNRTENELNTVKVKSEMKIQDLLCELASLKQNQDMQMADCKKLLKLVEKEETVKTSVNDLELKLTVSEYERQPIMEEATNMQLHVQIFSHLQDEVLALKNDLHSTKFEKEKLEASLCSLSIECEDLKQEKSLLVNNVSTLQNVTTELEDCKHIRVSLEEKLLQIEGDLMEKEALCAQEAELKKELLLIRRENKQFQQKIQLVEEEKDEYLTRAQTLEAELKMIKEEKHNRRESNGTKVSSLSKSHTKGTQNMKHSKNETLKNTYQHSNNRRKIALKSDQVQEIVKDQQKRYNKELQREGDKGNENHNECVDATDMELVARIELLENELGEAIEANNMYKLQLNRYWLEDRYGHVEVPSKSTVEGEVVTKEKFERTKSSLETELNDIRERYLHMSLKYAEVEAQREDLVMKLKEKKNGKRWFS